MGIKIQEDFHRQFLKLEAVLWGVFVFHLCPIKDALYKRILSHVTSTEYKHLICIRNVWYDSEKVNLQRHSLSSFKIILTSQMRELYSIFVLLPMCRKEVKCVVLCVVYLMMVSNSYLRKLNVTETGEGKLSTLWTVSWIHWKCYLWFCFNNRRSFNGLNRGYKKDHMEGEEGVPPAGSVYVVARKNFVEMLFQERRKHYS